MHGRVTVLLVVAAAVLLLASSAVAQPWPSCNGASGNYLAGSAYANNTLQLILGLQTNASDSPAYFASGSVGAGAAAVHGLMICRGDVSSNDCFDCGTRAWQDVQAVQPLCNRTRDAALADNQCYVRVAATDFLASPNNTGLVSVVGGASIPSGVDVAAYDAALRRLLNATARYAVDSSVPSSPPRLYFATGQFVGLDPRVPNIWSLAQCAGDLAPAQCRRCLDDLMTLWWNGSGFKPDGESAMFAGSRCNLKSDLGDKFYTSSPMVKLQMNSEVVVPAQAPSMAGKNNSSGKLLGIILPIMFVVVVTAIVLFVCKKRRYRGIKLPHGTHMAEDFESIKSTLLSLSSLQVATSNFDENNKLGEGGFGVVYKGDLSGQQVAVKRLSKGSGQGLEELKNELVLVAKLHHKNLVRLEGFCLEEGERLLVYEYMPNKSLDTILFDPEEKIRLDWRKRFNIIGGVARGLQYLHEESQKKIIHRDMKASNVLLDEDMNPKIGDFGLARLFGQDQTRDVTKHIVGTFGYMSPEYVMRGQFSTKSDVFSFGILVIEIITGRRNIGHYFFDEQNEDIISLVWRHWTEGTIVEMIDDSLGRNYSESEVLKCVNIGLLCLQHSPMDRPTMSDVMVMLNGDDTSSIPSAARPTFFLDRSTPYSYNSCTITHMSPR
uniref:Cysteine-rich receptor-like protein kinase 10 n=2 Tax=Zea mays TaxID=4577 RepID=A0A804QF90_MAIZE